jgi:hypothetical protein
MTIPAKEKAMELYVPTHQLKHVSEILSEEKVTFQVTDKKFMLSLEGKEAYEVTEVKATLLETEIPAVVDESPPKTIRAFRLPSGKRLLLTDADGNYERIVEVPPGWER